MSTYTTQAVLSWNDEPVQWSLAAYSSFDLTLSKLYQGYPTFDYSLNTTQAALVRAAFDAWESVSGIDFEEGADRVTADIRVGIDALDGRGSTLAQATYWWDSAGALEKASVTFDSGDIATAWTGSGAAPSEQWSFYTAALHEIGHAIGIGHISVATAVMYPYENGALALTDADIEQAVLRYGSSSSTASPRIASAADVDDTFYWAHYQDVARAGLDPQTHYDTYGWREQRDPTAWFDTAWYETQYTDIARAGINPYAHFQSYGANEGRDPNAWFDTQWYLSQNPDVMAAGLNPVEHYWANGWREGRDPSAAFDSSAYLDANPDVKAAAVNPLEHWLLYGEQEGRALA